VGLLQLVGGLGHGWWDPPEFVAATFVNHNHFAAYLELLLPLGCALWLGGPLKGPGRFLVAVCCAVMAVGFILSGSRGAWVSMAAAAAIGLGWFGIRQQPPRWSWRAVGRAVAAVAAIGFLVSQGPILTRGMSLLDAPNDPSFQTRRAIWNGAWGLVREHPMVGQGLSSFVFELPRHRPAGLYRLIPYAFNEYVQVMAELGLVGLLIGAWMALPVIRRSAWLIRFSYTPWKRAVGLGGLVGMTSVAIHSLVDYPLHVPAVAATFAAVAGLVTGIGYHADPSPLRRLKIRAGPSRRALWRRVAIPMVVAGLVASSRPVVRLIVADLWASRGHAHQEAGRFEDAAASYRQATRSAPSRSEYHRRLGEAVVHVAWKERGHARRAAFEEAAQAYQQALALVPHDASSAHALGEALKVLGDFEGADRSLAQAVRDDPSNPLYWKHWAELHLIRGDGAAAAKAFQRAAGLAKPYGFFPSLFAGLDDSAYFVRLGDSALLFGRLGYARTAFTIALHVDPTDAGARVGLALCAFSQGDSETAQQMMASVQAPPLRAKWFAGLAQYHLRQNQPAQARAALDTSLQLDPTNVLARHVQLVLARQGQDDLGYVEAVDQLLSLNRAPVFVRAGPAHEPLVVWEPEQGAYGQGRKTREGWAFSAHGTIEQTLALPPGVVTFAVTARGRSAKGPGARLALSWNGRLLSETEVTGETWATYTVRTEVKPGEQLLVVALTDPDADRVAHEDRTVDVDRVTVSWPSL